MAQRLECPVLCGWWHCGVAVVAMERKWLVNPPNLSDLPWLTESWLWLVYCKGWPFSTLMTKCSSRLQQSPALDPKSWEVMSDLLPVLFCLYLYVLSIAFAQVCLSAISRGLAADRVLCWTCPPSAHICVSLNSLHGGDFCGRLWEGLLMQLISLLGRFLRQCFRAVCVSVVVVWRRDVLANNTMRLIPHARAPCGRFHISQLQDQSPAD